MTDLRIVETFNGGDLVVSNNDLELTNQITNQVYLSLFGGNTEQSTPQINQDISFERLDFWGNDLFHPDEPDFQLNSSFERALAQTALNTEGIQQLEQIALQDLSLLSEFGSVTASISVTGNDRIKVCVSIDLKERYRDLVTTADLTIDLVVSGRPEQTWTDGVGTIWTDGVGTPFTDI